MKLQGQRGSCVLIPFLVIRIELQVEGEMIRPPAALSKGLQTGASRTLEISLPSVIGSRLVPWQAIREV